MGYRGSGAKIPDNAGYPRMPDRIAAFPELVEKTGKGFREEDRSALGVYFAKE